MDTVPEDFKESNLKSWWFGSDDFPNFQGYILRFHVALPGCIQKWPYVFEAGDTLFYIILQFASFCGIHFFVDFICVNYSIWEEWNHNAHLWSSFGVFGGNLPFKMHGVWLGNFS